VSVDLTNTRDCLICSPLLKVIHGILALIYYMLHALVCSTAVKRYLISLFDCRCT